MTLFLWTMQLRSGRKWVAQPLSHPKFRRGQTQLQDLPRPLRNRMEQEILKQRRDDHGPRRARESTFTTSRRAFRPSSAAISKGCTGIPLSSENEMGLPFATHYVCFPRPFSIYLPPILRDMHTVDHSPPLKTRSLRCRTVEHHRT